MFLGEVGNTKSGKLAKINKFLEENYGFTLDSSSDIDQLNAARDGLMEDIRRLKIDECKTPKDSEFAKTLLMLEGIDIMSTMARPSIVGFADPSVTNEYQNEIKNRILDELVNIAVCDITSGHPIESAISGAYNMYRASPSVFDDAQIECELRDRVHCACADIYRRMLDGTNEDMLTNVGDDGVYDVSGEEEVINELEFKNPFRKKKPEPKKRVQVTVPKSRSAFVVGGSKDEERAIQNKLRQQKLDRFGANKFDVTEIPNK